LEEKEINIPNPASFNPTHVIWAQDRRTNKRSAPFPAPYGSTTASSAFTESQDGPPATKIKRASVFDRLKSTTPMVTSPEDSHIANGILGTEHGKAEKNGPPDQPHEARLQRQQGDARPEKVSLTMRVGVASRERGKRREKTSMMVRNKQETARNEEKSRSGKIREREERKKKDEEKEAEEIGRREKKEGKRKKKKGEEEEERKRKEKPI